MAQQHLWHRRCRFYLGIPEPRWLGAGEVRGPVFLSEMRLRSRKSPYPRAGKLHPWARDSSAFSMIGTKGRWTIEPEDYVESRKRWVDELGVPDWCAAQDYMCEPFVTERTGLTVRQHQLLTVSRFKRLHALAPDLPWVPVLQGWEQDDYVRHIGDYERCGFDLGSMPLVGVGSTCRRQGSHSAGRIYRELHRRGLRLHGFGVSLAGVRLYHHHLVSADSMAWSWAARKESADPGWAANQLAVAERYRDRIEAAIDGDEQTATDRWREAMTWTRQR